MADGLDEAVQSFDNEVAPPTRPRDQGGKFVSTAGKAQPLFSAREVEGDPLTGDTRDGGDDPVLTRAEERADEYEQRRTTQNRQNLRRAEADDQHQPERHEPEHIWSDTTEDDPDFEGADQDLEAQPGERDAEGPSADDAEAEKYEVTVDGETHEVSLKEALRGYVRQATFHQRVAQLTNVQNEIEQENGKVSANWKMWDKARKDYEEDLFSMMPQEPNWEQEFARDPRAAYEQQKIFASLYGKLNASRQARAEREALEVIEQNRRAEKYAIEGFSRFIANNKIPDEPTLKKEIQSMRRTAADAGFSEYEVATVYDHRMLTVLRWASKYRRMMATRPRAIEPSKGRTLTPGAATPQSRNARRQGFDDAQRKLAQSGSIDDAAEVFRRML